MFYSPNQDEIKRLNLFNFFSTIYFTISVEHLTLYDFYATTRSSFICQCDNNHRNHFLHPQVAISILSLR